MPWLTVEKRLDPTVSDEQWLAARRELPDAEKALQRARDDLAARRRALPWRRIDANYTFDFYKAEDATRYHTLSTYARGLDPLNPVYQLLDLVPKGRDEEDLPYGMDWVRRHDEY